ncbi:Protein FAM161A like protein [Argiope bruennichi]|uniref:Protein FAM161A like protein n=1 Tax=Argiope bruennichi TaxID=94029 RepID=A0A8T0FB77_ARGBR|nr:Protein FAM161A like protein [Argiope bruennichi]
MEVNINPKQASFTMAVSCKDQTADIRNIQITANKALQNIYSLYNEIMIPKSNADVDCEASISDFSNDSTFSVGIKNSCHSYYSVPKLLRTELCSKCQKLVSLCSRCCKQGSNNILQSQHYSQITNKNSHQERSNSYPQVKPFCKNSYCSGQKDFYQQEQHAQKDASQEKRISRTESYCPEELQKNLLHKKIFSRSNSIQKEQNSDRDFCLQEKRNSYYAESMTGTDSEKDDSPNYTFKSVKESNMQFNITIPKPFSLSAENVRRQQIKEEKISKLREEINSQIVKELNVKFSPRPVPKHVHLPLYGEMMKMYEQRKKERKEKCIEIMNKKVKPFNLSTSAQTNVSRSKSMSNLSQEGSKTFKAKPVPKNILSENISQKVKNKEEVRKILIAQRAEELLKKSSLPFSPKPVQRSHSLYNISDSTCKSSVNVTREKIEAITKRLYSIKCQETVENWNNKVLQNDLWDAELSTSNKNYSKITFLREKQIRADIEMRKRREEMDESIRERIAQKRKEILKNIWPRLKSVEQVYDIGKEIEEKVKTYRESQKSREQEYEKELEDMMKRVSKQFLLIERQSKDLKEKIIDTTRSIDEMSEKEVSVSEAENDSSEEVESSASSSTKSDSA